MSEAVYNNIKRLLEENGITCEEIEHPPVKTTEDSYAFRKERGWVDGAGSKNILFHAKGRFYIAVTTADMVYKARIFKREFGTKDIRFAYDDELLRETGCESGALPPFGILNDNLPIYVASDILSLKYFMFNPGINTKSIRIKPDNLLNLYAKIPNIVKIFSIGDDSVEFQEVQNKF
jgi:hypothetical protein